MALEIEADRSHDRDVQVWEEDAPGEASRGWPEYLRWLSFAVLIGSILTITRSLPFDEAMTAVNGWLAGLGPWGPVALALLYIVATVLFVPGTILTLAAGALFGLVVGMVAVSVGSTLGAAAAFLIARYLARDRVAAMAGRHRHFGAIDRAIGEGGWKVVALLRLSPAVPFNVQNYLYGLTPVRFWPYVVTSWIAMMPGTFLYIYLGHVTGAAIGDSRERGVAEWLMLAVGLLATAAVTVYVTRLARQKLNDQLDEPQATGVQGEREEASGEASAEETKSAGRGIPFRLVLAAAVALLAAVFVRANADRIELRLASLFGPPRVELQESYGGTESAASFDHAGFDEILRRHVDADGWVDYGALQADEGSLDRYLERVAKAPFDELGRDEKLALLINAYNAATLKLIVERWPLDSIMEIPESQRWDDRRWEVAGRTWSLNQIEHEQIRPHFAEPRIHFALVCAAVGCPPLRNEAYRGERLETQLESQTRYVHEHSTWFAFDANEGRVSLTKLYQWYGDDFEQAAGSVLAYASRYSSPLDRAIDSGESPRITWLSYDWSINDRTNRAPR